MQILRALPGKIIQTDWWLWRKYQMLAFVMRWVILRGLRFLSAPGEFWLDTARISWLPAGPNYLVKSLRAIFVTFQERRNRKYPERIAKPCGLVPRHYSKCVEILEAYQLVNRSPFHQSNSIRGAV